MSDHEAARVRCPFYRRSGRKGCFIRCEGIGMARSTTLTYRGERQRTRQLEVFCQDCFAKCEVYRMIIESRGLDNFYGDKTRGFQKNEKPGKP